MLDWIEISISRLLENVVEFRCLTLHITTHNGLSRVINSYPKSTLKQLSKMLLNNILTRLVELRFLTKVEHFPKFRKNVQVNFEPLQKGRK